MKAFKMFLLVLIFGLLFVGIIMAFFAKFLVSKKKNTVEVANRKVLRLKLIGYVLMMSALAIAIFRGLIEV